MSAEGHLLRLSMIKKELNSLLGIVGTNSETAKLASQIFHNAEFFAQKCIRYESAYGKAEDVEKIGVKAMPTHEIDHIALKNELEQTKQWLNNALQERNMLQKELKKSAIELQDFAQAYNELKSRSEKVLEILGPKLTQEQIESYSRSSSEQAEMEAINTAIDFATEVKSALNFRSDGFVETNFYLDDEDVCVSNGKYFRVLDQDDIVKRLNKYVQILANLEKFGIPVKPPGEVFLQHLEKMGAIEASLISIRALSRLQEILDKTEYPNLSDDDLGRFYEMYPMLIESLEDVITSVKKLEARLG